LNEPLRILGIPGSLRSASYNRAALFAAQSLLPDHTSLEIISLDGLPLFNEDREAEPAPSVTEFKHKIRDADAIYFLRRNITIRFPVYSRMPSTALRGPTAIVRGQASPSR